MAYITGGVITALDYNDLILQVNEVFADLPVGQRINDTYGYGQEIPELVEVAADEIIKAEEWNMLYTVIKRIGWHQGYYNDGNRPPGMLDDVTAGEDLIAAYNEMQGIIDDLRGQRFDVYMLGDTLSETSSRTDPWDEEVVHEFRLIFSNYDDARYFFNTGSTIIIEAEFEPANAASPTPVERAWADSLRNVGEVIHNYDTTVADAGSSFNIGFYDLTTSYKLVLQKNITEDGNTIYSYDEDAYRVYIKLSSAAKNALDVKVVFASKDDDEPVTGTLISTVRTKVTEDINMVVSSPVYSKIEGVDEGS